MRYAEDLISELRDGVSWKNVARTFGNCHCTLIGAIVQWWNSMDECYAFEPGVSTGYKLEGRKFQVCDAILCKGEAQNPIPVGILEVEHDLVTFINNQRFEPYLHHSRAFNEVEFVLLVAYDYEAKGGRQNPEIKNPIDFKQLIAEARKMPLPSGIRFFLVMVHRQYTKAYPKDSLRNKNGYTPCTVNRVEAAEVTKPDSEPVLFYQA